ncbi:MAG: DEAD/DEAH box helicase [Gemmatimonadota bacterium]
MIVRVAAARALIAAHWLPDREGPSEIGTVRLHAHQRSAVDRIRDLLRGHRGALLADEAGLGKTYVAAALLREAENPLLIVPAALRLMWRDALAASGASATLISYTALSRGTLPLGDFDLLVLDEAHHARTASTRRYAAIASLAARARVLLLTATPVHNCRAELAALFALFLGARAYAMSDQAFGTMIVRRERSDIVHAVAIPDAPAPEWISVPDDGLLLEPLLALPPPLPPSDGGEGGVLLTWSLLRQWASSRAALAGALRRRIARGLALECALSEGRYPGQRELSAWSSADDAIQLAFPQLVSGPVAAPEALLARVGEHVSAARALLARVLADPSIDAARAQAIRDIRLRHPGEKVLVFSQYTDTVHQLFVQLRGIGGVAALSARGGRIASGRLSRQETLERFAPRATGAQPPREAERIDVLLTTDLASEGLNLHDASVVVHADLPWTPARLEQRVARSRRLGALHTRTHSYALAPPASAESVLTIEQRLREKLRTMEEVIGTGGAILPDLSASGSAIEPSQSSSARLREEIDRALRRWHEEDQREVGGEACAASLNEFHDGVRGDRELVVACGAAPRSAVVALALIDSRAVLAAAVCDIGETERDTTVLTEDPRVVLEAIALTSGSDAALDERVRADAVARAERWLARRQGAEASGALAWRGASRRIALRRIAGLSARAPHHRRALLAPLTMIARRVVTAPYALGAERVLDELASAPLPDEAWLRALASFGAMHGAREGERAEARLVAVIVAG